MAEFLSVYGGSLSAISLATITFDIRWRVKIIVNMIGNAYD
jgi:hypothetical protein